MMPASDHKYAGLHERLHNLILFSIGCQFSDGQFSSTTIVLAMVDLLIITFMNLSVTIV